MSLYTFAKKKKTLSSLIWSSDLNHIKYFTRDIRVKVGWKKQLDAYYFMCFDSFDTITLNKILKSYVCACIHIFFLCSR